jgi:hypothetical protein
VIPEEVLRLLYAHLPPGAWSGKITMNVKDGAILDVEVAQRHRAQPLPPPSRQIRKGL